MQIKVNQLLKDLFINYLFLTKQRNSYCNSKRNFFPMCWNNSLVIQFNSESVLQQHWLMKFTIVSQLVEWFWVSLSTTKNCSWKQGYRSNTSKLSQPKEENKTKIAITQAHVDLIFSNAVTEQIFKIFILFPNLIFNIPPEKVRQMIQMKWLHNFALIYRGTFSYLLKWFYVVTLFWQCFLTKGSIPKVHYRTIKSETAFPLQI